MPIIVFDKNLYFALGTFLNRCKKRKLNVQICNENEPMLRTKIMVLSFKMFNNVRVSLSNEHDKFKDILRVINLKGFFFL